MDHRAFEARGVVFWKASTQPRQSSEKTVMPAWIAGIQISQDASANIHVNLGSSTPCWNDEGASA
jgi:hypothetical protein